MEAAVVMEGGCGSLPLQCPLSSPYASAVESVWHTWLALSECWPQPVGGWLCLEGLLWVPSLCGVAAEARGPAGSCSERAKETGWEQGFCGF